MLTRKTRDGFWLYLARLSLRHMSNSCAWRWYTEMGKAYRQRPDLARED